MLEKESYYESSIDFLEGVGGLDVLDGVDVQIKSMT